MSHTNTDYTSITILGNLLILSSHSGRSLRKLFLSSSSPTKFLSQIFATHPTHRLELFSILEVMDSNLDLEAEYPDSGLSWSYLDTPSKYQANNLKQVIINCFLSFPIHCLQIILKFNATNPG